MRSAPRLTALLVVAALLLAGGAAAPTATATGPSTPAVDGPPAAALDAPANTTVEVRLYANASARWTVRTTYLLESDEERAAFSEYAAAYRAGETDDGPRVDPFVAAADRAAAASGREMAVTNVTRAGGVDGATGTVSVSFRWTNFLSRADDSLRLDDALSVGGGSTWLGSLGEDQTLVVRTPPGYSIVDSDGPSFEIRDNAVRFEGPREFETPLTVTYRRTAGPTPTPDPEGQGLPWGLLGGGAVVVALALAVGYTLRRDRRPGDPAPGATTSDGGAASGDGGAEPAPAPDETGPRGDEDEDEDEAGVDPELLSDDERVERMLERNGGRMRQAAIVDETGWSDAKVSQLLSSMADEGRVEKLRLGRENLISLPDDEDGE